MFFALLVFSDKISELKQIANQSMLNNLLSNKARPHLISLMQHFNLALTQEIHFYERHQDTQHFVKILDYLNHDFAYFAQHLNCWQYQSPTAIEQTELNCLEQHLNEARGLITQAALLLDRRQTKI